MAGFTRSIVPRGRFSPASPGGKRWDFRAYEPLFQYKRPGAVKARPLARSWKYSYEKMLERTAHGIHSEDVFDENI
jgi:hypothetical protein